MRPKDRDRFPPRTVTLKDDRAVTLRPLTTDDTEALGDFYLSIERAAYRFYCPNPLTCKWSEKRTAAADEPTSVTLVAENNTGQIAGYAWYRWDEDKPEKPSLFGICIRKAYRGVALGQALIAHLLEIAEEVGPPVMSLTVQKANARAFGLYSKMGFEVVREQERGRVEEFPPEPEYYMEQRIRDKSA